MSTALVNTNDINVKLAQGGFGGVGPNEQYSNFIFPSGAEFWGGWAYLSSSGDAIEINNNETITVTGRTVNPGETVSIYFKFEEYPHPNNGIQFNTESIILTENETTFDIPVDGGIDGQQYLNFLMYASDRDIEFTLSSVIVTDPSAASSSGDPYITCFEE